jgi:transposase
MHVTISPGGADATGSVEIARRTQGGDVIEQDELHAILDLHREGLTVTAIARRLNRDRKTVYKYLRSGCDQVRYVRQSPRPSKVAAFDEHLWRRLARFPDLTAARLLQELRAKGYSGSATILKYRIRELRQQIENGEPRSAADASRDDAPGRRGISKVARTGRDGD